MIIFRSVLHTNSIFRASLKNYKIQSSNLHVLCVRPRLRAARSPTSIFSAEINQIIARFESSGTAAKDVILNLPQEATSSATSNSSDGLPDLPISESAVSDIPEIIAEAIVPLNKLGEPTLQSLGLGSYWTPVGWVQNWLEWTHCTFNLPWWASISVCIITARLLLFPIVIKSQRNSIKLHNVMPEMQEIQTRMQDARTYGNDVEAMKCAVELGNFMKEKNVKPVSAVGLPFCQAPVFLSFFMGLRNMANAPVESFKIGGLWWFEDLTVPDPYFILPLTTCATLLMTIQVGAEFTKMPSGSTFGRVLPSLMKAIPFGLFPFIMYFPSAVCVYWATTNAVTLIQVLFLRIPKIRQYFDIESKIKHTSKTQNSLKKENFVKGMKLSWKNMKIAKEVEERDRLDEMSFKRAGRAPPAKTFKKNPLLKEEPVIQAKRN